MRIIFTSSNLPFALLIRAMTGCKWHHCGVLVDDVVYESRAFIGVDHFFSQIKQRLSGKIDKMQFGGVAKTPLEVFKARGINTTVSIPLPDEGGAVEFLDSQLGKGYDWTGIMSYPFQRNWQEDTKWSCSELAAKAASAGNRDIVRKEINCITPRDLWVQVFDVVDRDIS